MKHEILSKVNLSHPYFLLKVRLLPETAEQKEAITKVQLMEANEDQKGMIENYLLFNVGSNFSVHKVERQDNDIFYLKASAP